MLLRGERMRSGRRDSKINRRNLSKDRDISLTMRALVRAKWSERGGGWKRKVRDEGISEVEKKHRFRQNMPELLVTSFFTV